MKNKKFCIIVIIFVVFSIILLNNININSVTKVVSYNGNNLRISVDGEVTSTLPSTGTYYLVDYDCSSTNTEVSWDNINYKLNVSNGTKKGGVSCYLDFKSRPLLSEMPVGSYVKYTGNNGCTEESCSGQNANYVSDTDMGYCYSSKYKFYVNGWRIGYIENGSAYLVSAGSTDCMCTSSDGTSSNSSCGDYLSSTDLYKHFDNMDALALKYCNSDYANGGVCDSTSVWAMDAIDFQKITGSSLSSSSCFNSFSNISCGYTNNLIDNGGYYWFATKYSTSSNYSFYWIPYIRNVNYNHSSNLRGVRPVLYLESSVIVTGGAGTYEDPYLISNNSFLINDGASYVTANNSSSVELSLFGNDVDTMCISVNSSVCTNYIDFTDTYTFDWSNEEDGEKIIYVTYKNSDGEIIASMNRKIILDTIVPTNNSVTIGSQSSLTRTLTLSSTGADYMCFSNTSNNASDCIEWVDYATTYQWTLTGGEGQKTVYAFFMDEAGNIGTVASDTVTYTKTCLGVSEVFTLDYSGASVNSDNAEVKFCAGTYTLQVWGAQGGNTGGNGGYSTGDITLAGTETLYFYVGGAGALGTGGFNGGGSAGTQGGGGGGATDIRINYDDLNARVIVAGGGGGKGQDSCAAGGAGGGTSGIGGLAQNSCGTQGGAGTQSAGGAVGVYSSTSGANAGTFGVGGSASDGSYDGGGGGGGWYGGGAGASAGWSNGGGGGSGFVFIEPVSSDFLFTGTDYMLTNASTLDGTQTTIPTIDGTSTETGHTGNGYIKITRVS